MEPEGSALAFSVLRSLPEVPLLCPLVHLLVSSLNKHLVGARAVEHGPEDRSGHSPSVVEKAPAQ